MLGAFCFPGRGKVFEEVTWILILQAALYEGTLSQSICFDADYMYMSRKVVLFSGEALTCSLLLPESVARFELYSVNCVIPIQFQENFFGSCCK